MRKYLLGFTVFSLAFGILSVSLLSSSSPKYAFAAISETQTSILGVKEVNVDYTLAYPGKITPDNTFWMVKVLRDNSKLFLTRNKVKKAEILLLISDKRLGMAKDLFEKGKPELGFETLAKGENYLFQSFETAGEYMTIDLANKLALSSLKHRQIIENIALNAPEDAKPEIMKVLDTSKKVYNLSRDFLNSKGVKAPINPFEKE